MTVRQSRSLRLSPMIFLRSITQTNINQSTKFNQNKITGKDFSSFKNAEGNINNDRSNRVISRETSSRSYQSSSSSRSLSKSLFLVLSNNMSIRTHLKRNRNIPNKIHILLCREKKTDVNSFSCLEYRQSLSITCLYCTIY